MIDQRTTVDDPNVYRNTAHLTHPDPQNPYQRSIPVVLFLRGTDLIAVPTMLAGHGTFESFELLRQKTIDIPLDITPEVTPHYYAWRIAVERVRIDRAFGLLHVDPDHQRQKINEACDRVETWHGHLTAFEHDNSYPTVV